MGLTAPYQRLFGLSFAGRPVFKIILAIAVFIIGAVLLTAFVLAIGRLSGLIEGRALTAALAGDPPTPASTANADISPQAKPAAPDAVEKRR